LRAHRASTSLELLLDLVFVVAIAQAASGLHHAIGEAHAFKGLIGYRRRVRALVPGQTMKRGGTSKAKRTVNGRREMRRTGAAMSRSGSNWRCSGHHPFLFILDRPQVAEGRCGYAGSNKAVSVERNSVWKEQLVEPLALLE